MPAPVLNRSPNKQQKRGNDQNNSSFINKYIKYSYLINLKIHLFCFMKRIKFIH